MSWFRKIISMKGLRTGLEGYASGGWAGLAAAEFGLVGQKMPDYSASPNNINRTAGAVIPSADGNTNGNFLLYGGLGIAALFLLSRR